MLQMTRRILSVVVVTALAGVFMPTSALADGCKIGTWGVDLEARDHQTAPGNDFFRYANGAWLDAYEIPDDLPGQGAFIQLFLESEEQVKAIIEDAAASAEGGDSIGGKVGELYRGYLDTEAIEAKGLTPLDPYLQEIRVAEDHERIAYLMAKFDRVDGGMFGGGGSTPFAFYIDQDEKDPSTYLPKFIQSGLGLPDRDYYLDDENPRFVEARQVYEEYLAKLFKILGEDNPEGRAAKILELETKIAEAHWPSEEMRDVEKTYNKMTVSELAELAPQFPWEGYMKALGMGNQKDIVVLPPSAYQGMAKVFQETPVEVWKDFMAYRLLRNNASFLPQEVDQTHFEFTSKAMSGSKEQRARWKRGVGFVNGAMGDAVGELYVKKHFSEQSKKRVDELVDNLIVAMGDRIDHLDWMSDATKKEAHDKLSKFVVKIGYPDEFRDYSKLEIKHDDLLGNALRARAFTHDRNVAKLGKPVDRTEWFMPPQMINAYYNPGMNEIVFPAGILQPPFFDAEADDAVNYGGIGAVIGHEIGHGFDDQGRKVDGDGVLRDWWTEEDAERFKKRADMLVEQYNAFSPLEGMHVNGELTLGENIGDLGGLEIAYHAYKLSLHGKEAPIIDGLTGDQRFFLGFAQIWKGKMRDQILTQLIASNPHSPLEYRVNGVLPNIDVWYEAFDIGPDQKMYIDPKDRVRIW